MVLLKYDVEASSQGPISRTPVNLAFAAAAAARASWASKERTDIHRIPDLWDDTPIDGSTSSPAAMATAINPRSNGNEGTFGVGDGHSSPQQSQAGPSVIVVPEEGGPHDIPRNSVLFRVHATEHILHSSLPLAAPIAPSAVEVASALEDRRTRVVVHPYEASPDGLLPQRAASFSLGLITKDENGATYSSIDGMVVRTASYLSQPQVTSPSEPITNVGALSASAPLGGTATDDGDVASAGTPTKRDATGTGDGACDATASPAGDSATERGCLVLPALRTLLAMSDGVSPLQPPQQRPHPAQRPSIHGPQFSGHPSLIRMSSQPTLRIGAGGGVNVSTSGAAASSASSSGTGPGGLTRCGSLVNSPARRRCSTIPAPETSTRLGRATHTRSFQVSSPPPAQSALVDDDAGGGGGALYGEDMEPLGRALSYTPHNYPTAPPAVSASFHASRGQRDPPGRSTTASGFTAGNCGTTMATSGYAGNVAPGTMSGAGSSTNPHPQHSPLSPATSFSPSAAPLHHSATTLAPAPPPVAAAPRPAATATAATTAQRSMSRSASERKSISSKALFSWTHKLGGSMWPWSNASAAGSAAAGGGGGGVSSGGGVHPSGDRASLDVVSATGGAGEASISPTGSQATPGSGLHYVTQPGGALSTSPPAYQPLAVHPSGGGGGGGRREQLLVQLPPIEGSSSRRSWHSSGAPACPLGEAPSGAAAGRLSVSMLTLGPASPQRRGAM